jgi:hypothetical protein
MYRGFFNYVTSDIATIIFVVSLTSSFGNSTQHFRRFLPGLPTLVKTLYKQKTFIRLATLDHYSVTPILLITSLLTPVVE